MNAPFAPERDDPTTVLQVDLRDDAATLRIAAFVDAHDGSPFHLSEWLIAIERGTSQEACGIVAEQAGRIIGWLPLTLVHSPLFGRALVSSGFAVDGGVLADAPHVAL